MFPSRSLAAGLVVLAAFARASPASGATQAATVLICTNLVSGFSWQIKIDFEQSTVDSNPAKISSAAISWRDGARGPWYTLDRASGNLTVNFTSSTGGYSIRDSCRPPS